MRSRYRGRHDRQPAASNVKRLLMIAFHFPPLAGSSGIQRTLRFARHLPRFGWQPLILTAHPRAYERLSDDLVKDVSDDCVVERAFALDSARHLSIRGRYPAFPHGRIGGFRGGSGAIPKGLAMIRRYRADAIWSTYPIATATRSGIACSAFPACLGGRLPRSHGADGLSRRSEDLEKL